METYTCPHCGRVYPTKEQNNTHCVCSGPKTASEKRATTQTRSEKAKRRQVARDKYTICESNQCGHWRGGGGCGKGCDLLKAATGLKRCRTFDYLLEGGGCLADPPLFNELSQDKKNKATWAVGITTAPREEPTLEDSLKSIHAAGWEDVRIFIDGDVLPPSGYSYTRRSSAAGAFSNWILALQELVVRDPAAKYYLLFQDDVRLCKGARERVEALALPGIVSLYQSFHQRDKGIHICTPPRRFVGALGLAFDRETAHKLLSSWFMIDHRQRTSRNNDYIDGSLGFWCEKNEVPLWIHSPSLIQHTGHTSTLGHTENPSRTFLGEDVDASSLPEPKPVMEKSSKPVIGVVGFNTAQGLGYVTRSAVEALDVARFISVKHKRFPDLPPLKMRGTFLKSESRLSDSKAQELLYGLDVLLFFEMTPIQNLTRIAKRLGIKVVCVPMVEWLPLNDDWMNYVDLWLAPTLFSYNQLIMREVKGRIEYAPWPIHAKDFPFRQRTRVERYLYIQGNGGPHDRKGGQIVAEAAKLVPHIPLTVFSQVQDGFTSFAKSVVKWPEHIDFRGAAMCPSDLYGVGDVLLAPSRWEGLGLQLYEGQAAGLPLITTNAPPMNEAAPWRTLPCSPQKVMLSHEYASFNVSPEDLARGMEENYGANIEQASQAASQWVREHRDWKVCFDSIYSKITRGR